jgi:pilus assembly protein FimV
MLGIVTALLALVVLIIAWVLRRINTRRDDIGNAPRITEAMVQEKLDQINLDLRESSGDRSAPAKD